MLSSLKSTLNILNYAETIPKCIKLLSKQGAGNKSGFHPTCTATQAPSRKANTAELSLDQKSAQKAPFAKN